MPRVVRVFSRSVMLASAIRAGATFVRNARDWL
jgi:hypothetical protein